MVEFHSRFSFVPKSLNYRTSSGSEQSKNCDENRLTHNGILSCFFQGFSNALFRNFLRPKAIRRRVECG